ncbi:MAG: alkyl sulfatase dimerization domain-containing protein [Myxococcota bacterium]
MRPSPGSPGPAWVLAAVLAIGACSTRTPVVGDLTDEDRAEYARVSLERARVLQAEGDLRTAERLLRSVVAVAPDDRRARALQIQLLEEMGWSSEAADARRDLRRLRPEPVPTGPADLPSEGLLITVTAQEVGEGRDAAHAASISEGLSVALGRRVRTRLPDARLVRRVPGSVEEGRAWLARYQPRAVLALRGARSFCGESVRDGTFAVAELEIATGAAGAVELEQLTLIERLFDPDPESCVEEVAARALERVMDHPTVGEALAAPPTQEDVDWSARAIREIFPALDAAIEARAEKGRQAMRKGRFEDALARFREAARLDPEDGALADLVGEAQASLDMHRELLGRPGTFVADVAAEAPASLVEER